MKSFLDNFYRHLAIFSGHTGAWAIFVRQFGAKKLKKIPQSGHTVHKEAIIKMLEFFCILVFKYLPLNTLIGCSNLL